MSDVIAFIVFFSSSSLPGTWNSTPVPIRISNHFLAFYRLNKIYIQFNLIHSAQLQFKKRFGFQKFFVDNTGTVNNLNKNKNKHTA